MSIQTSPAPAPVSPLRLGPGQSLRHGAALAGRSLTKLRKSPAQLADVMLTPIISLLMFYYLFGGAIGGGNLHGYLLQIVPGVMVMTVYQATIGIGVSLNADATTGVFDRFRSMPIARSAPLLGAVLADVVRYLACLAVLVLVGFAMGYRVAGDPLAALAAVGLLLAFALSFSWMSVFAGMLLKTPGSVYGLMTVVTLPLTFASNVFVPTRTMPGWLQAWSNVNPISLMTQTVRGLLDGAPVARPLLESLAWMAGVVVVFFPAAMRGYRTKAS
jgi:oleandomycin transport system permease protein